MVAHYAPKGKRSFTSKITHLSTMKLSHSSLLALLHLYAASSCVGAERVLRSSLGSSSSSSSSTLTAEESHENLDFGHYHNSNANGNVRSRKLIDFVIEAEEAEKEDQIETLEDNGDANQVEIVDSAAGEQQEEEEMNQDIDAMEQQLPAAEVEEVKIKNRRKLVRYEPSEWETQWIDQIDDIMEAKSLCRSLLGSDAQKEKMHKFLVHKCSIRTSDGWCYFEDATHFVWYNSENRDTFEIYVNERPDSISVLPQMTNPRELSDPDGTVLSKFVFFDEVANEEYTEYIEPLVSHLRFPLAGCKPNLPLLAELTIGVLSPGYLDRTNLRKIIYDYGSSDWGRVHFILKEWGLYNTEFSEIISYSTYKAGEEAEDLFPKTVPRRERGRVFREYLELVDAPSEDPSKVFIPEKITEEAVVNDYIILKLDTGNAVFKENLIQYIIEHADDLHIDELLWVQNNPDNYNLQKYMEMHASFEDMSSTTLGDTYRSLQALRYKGIRAHAWN